MNILLEYTPQGAPRGDWGETHTEARPTLASPVAVPPLVAGLPLDDELAFATVEATPERRPRQLAQPPLFGAGLLASQPGSRPASQTQAELLAVRQIQLSLAGLVGRSPGR